MTPRFIFVPEVYPPTGDPAYPVIVRIYGGAPPVITDLIVLEAPKHASLLPVSVAPVSAEPTVTVMFVPSD